MKAKVLIVDDEKFFVKGMRHSLEQDGYVTDVVDNGKDAMKKIKKKNLMI